MVLDMSCASPTLEIKTRLLDGRRTTFTLDRALDAWDGLAVTPEILGEFNLPPGWSIVLSEESSSSKWKWWDDGLECFKEFAVPPEWCVLFSEGSWTFKWRDEGNVISIELMDFIFDSLVLWQAFILQKNEKGSWIAVARRPEMIPDQS